MTTVTVYYYIGDYARFTPLKNGIQLEILNPLGKWIIQNIGNQ